MLAKFDKGADDYRAKMEKFLSVARFIAEFKKDRYSRFTFMRHKEFGENRAKEVVMDAVGDEVTESTMKLMPVDHRRYKPSILKDVAATYTYRPKVEEKSRRISTRHEVKVMLEKLGLPDCSTDLSEEDISKIQAEKGLSDKQVSILSKLINTGKLDFNEKYELMLFEYKNKEAKNMERLEKLKAFAPREAEEKELVFKPKINKSKQFENVRPRFFGNHNLFSEMLKPNADLNEDADDS
jgi:hypothetical protein